jgi:hypothetical protein
MIHGRSRRSPTCCAVAAALALALASPGCDDEKPSADIAVGIDGAPTARLRYGRAYPGSDGLVLRLSERPRTCETPPTHDAGTTLYLDLPPGPGGTFFAGQPAGLPVRVSAALGDVLWARAYESAVTLEPFVAKPGGRVRGTLRFAASSHPRDRDRTIAGTGSFDVEICGGKGGLHVAPQAGEAPAGDVRGTFAGRSFAWKAALVEVGVDPRSKVRRVERLVFLPEAGGGCEALSKTGDADDVLEVRDIGGAGGATPLAGTPQPADVFVGAGQTRGGPLGGRLRAAWVRFEALDFTAGHKVTGALYADSGPGAEPVESGSLGGRFTAEVCGPK